MALLYFYFQFRVSVRYQIEKRVILPNLLTSHPNNYMKFEILTAVKIVVLAFDAM